MDLKAIGRQFETYRTAYYICTKAGSRRVAWEVVSGQWWLYKATANTCLKT